MSVLPVYLDSSALLKLALPEAERAALAGELERWPDWVSSELAAVECHRAVRRAGGNASLRARVQHVLDCCTLVRLDAAVLKVAEHIGPPNLRSLDAIHLAAAVSLGDLPEAFITYDDRLAGAARRLKLRVLQPGA
jgi:predicted nucleic acid-binding protein